MISSPANILIFAEVSVKLLDFGLATMTSTANDRRDDANPDGRYPRHPAAYMSPEQAQGKQLDERSDIFSFGAVLYEMLSGKRALRRRFYGGCIERRSARRSRAPSKSPAAVIVSDDAWRSSQVQRFQSTAELKTGSCRMFCTTKPAQSQPSIAVLPFANMSGDKETSISATACPRRSSTLWSKFRG